MPMVAVVVVVVLQMDMSAYCRNTVGNEANAKNGATD